MCVRFLSVRFGLFHHNLVYPCWTHVLGQRNFGPCKVSILHDKFNRFIKLREGCLAGIERVGYWSTWVLTFHLIVICMIGSVHQSMHVQSLLNRTEGWILPGREYRPKILWVSIKCIYDQGTSIMLNHKFCNGFLLRK